MTKDDIIKNYDWSVEEHRRELEDQDSVEDAEDFYEDWYRLEDVVITPATITLVMDKPVESGDGEMILAYAFGPVWYDRNEVESGNKVIVNVLDI